MGLKANLDIAVKRKLPPLLATKPTSLSLIPVDGKNVFSIIFKGYLITKFLCAALSVTYTWLTDVRVSSK